MRTRFARGILALLLGACSLGASALAQEDVLRPRPPQPEGGALRRFSFVVPLGERRVEVELYTRSEADAQARETRLRSSLQNDQQLLERLTRLIDAARKGTVPLPPEFYGLLDKLRSVCDLSQGAFDPTTRPLREIWGFTAEALAYRLPRPEEIALARKDVGCSKLELQAVPPTLYLANPGLRLDGELFAAGWLLDRAIAQIKDLPAAMLRSGAVAYYHGSPPDAQAWKVPLPDPRAPENPLDYLYLRNQALSILGDYQNYFLHNGIRYSSLLDPRTGYPTRETVAVSVTAASALDAELIAYATAVLDDTGTKDLLKRLQRSSVIKIVDRNGLLLPLRY